MGSHEAPPRSGPLSHRRDAETASASHQHTAALDGGNQLPKELNFLIEVLGNAFQRVSGALIDGREIGCRFDFTCRSGSPWKLNKTLSYGVSR